MRLRMMAEYEAGVAAVAATDSPTAKGSLWVETGSPHARSSSPLRRGSRPSSLRTGAGQAKDDV